MAFYKYTNIRAGGLILENESLRWSSPVIFNDLEECQFTPFTKEQHISAHEEYLNILTECAKGRLTHRTHQYSEITTLIIHTMKMSIENGTFTTENFSDVLVNITSNPESDYREFVNKALIKSFRVLCATTEYDNSLMWAHYADQHYGCVFEIDKFYIEKPYLLREGPIRYHENLKPS